MSTPNLVNHQFNLRYQFFFSSSKRPSNNKENIHVHKPKLPKFEKKKIIKWLILRLSDIMDTYQGLFVKIDDYNTIPNSTYKIIYKLPPKNVSFFPQSQ